MINVYAPNHYRDKEVCWNTLKYYLLQVKNNNIIIGEYFNLVLNAKEKFGGKFHADPPRETIETTMDSSNLMDLPPINGKYTWSSKRLGKNNIKEKVGYNISSRQNSFQLQ